MSLSVLVDFLRRELTPTPGRGAATLRLTLSCIAATIPIFTHRIPHAMIVMIVMYLVTVEDTAGTIMATILGWLGATLSLAAALLALEICMDLPWLRVCLFAMFLTGGLFLKSTISIPGLGSAIGLPGSLALVLPDILPPQAEPQIYFILWAWTCMTVGLSVNICVQLLLSKSDPLTLLKRGLDTRLQAVESVLGNLAENESVEPLAASLDHLAIAGMSRPLALLKSAALINPWVRERKDGIAAIITLVDRLVTAAVALTKLPAQYAGLLPYDMLVHVAEGCDLTRRAFDELRLPSPCKPLASADEQKTGPVSLLLDMEQILRQIALAFSENTEEPGQSRPTPEQKFSLFVPDAFENPAHFRFAIKGALAAMICYVLFVGFDYPGIYTSVITCFVVSLSTIGASNQKGILRFIAAGVGGAMGLFSLVYLFPHIDTLGGFWAVLGAGTAVAAWINFGSPRISYLGYQIGLTFYKSIFQSFGPSVSATVIRDRLIGVFLGLIVFGIVEHYLWPVSAAARMRERLADVLHSLGELALVCAGKAPAGGKDVEELRRLISQQVADLQSFIESSKFEIEDGPGRVERLTADAQSIFLVLLAIGRHQKERPALPEWILESLTGLEAETATALTALAEAMHGQEAALSIDFDNTVTALEDFISAHEYLGRDAAVGYPESLALYRELAGAVRRLLQSASMKTEAELSSPLLSVPNPT
jgi:multidrug resistance protein MdtO